MKKYKVKITEILEKTVEIEADDSKEAADKVMELYHNQQIILYADDHIGTEFSDAEEIKEEFDYV